ncbi:MAG: SpoIID/LytB domain-containing protein [Candidatus Bruticola sp.]
MKIKLITSNSLKVRSIAAAAVKILGLSIALLMLLSAAVYAEVPDSPLPAPTPTTHSDNSKNVSAVESSAEEAGCRSRSRRHKASRFGNRKSGAERKAVDWGPAPKPYTIITPEAAAESSSLTEKNGPDTSEGGATNQESAVEQLDTSGVSPHNERIAQLEGLSCPIRVLIYQGRGPVRVSLKPEPSPSFCPSAYQGGADLVINGRATGQSTAEIGQDEASAEIVSCASGFVLQIGSEAYRGCLKAERLSGSLYVVNYLSLEDYLRGVIPKELLCSAPEAMKAQAVAARTYAWARRSNNKVWDVDCSTNSQVYGGAAVETIQSDRATADTAGQVLTYNGRLADQTLYHSACGGQTESPLYIYGSESAPYLASVECVNEDGEADCSASGYYSWQARWSETELGQELSQYFGKKLGPVSGLEIAEQGPSGRVSKLRIHFQNGSTETLEYGAVRSAMRFKDASGRYRSLPSAKFVIVSGNYMQTEPKRQEFQEELPALGQVLNLLDTEYSTLNSNSEAPVVECEHEPGYIVVSGQGWGHGGGMCQWGAIGMAKRGQSYLQILSRYFTGTQVDTLENLP